MKGKTININCDLGEGVAVEPQLFPYLYSCSIACGGHYGDRSSIQATLKESIKYDVKVGTHPSYPDKEHFGRQTMYLTKAEFQDSLHKQLLLYFECLDAMEIKNNHIKAHGALYNDLIRQSELATWYLEVVKAYDYGVLYTPYGSELAKLAKAQGMLVSFEAFLDRNYLANASLVPRSHPNALKKDPIEVWKQLFNLMDRGGVFSIDGNWITLPASTFCLHGDHPRVLEFLTFINQQLNMIG